MAELRPWPFNGYAPGNYNCRCTDCEKVFEGDKRAVTCLECAVLATKNTRSPGSAMVELREALERAAQMAAALRIANDGCSGFEPSLSVLQRTADQVADFLDSLASHPASAGEGLWQDIFAEITAKAEPLCEDESDPEKVTGYRLPVGPIHRAAGKTGFQMFDGEKHLRRAVRENQALWDYLESIGGKPVDPLILAEYTRRMKEEVIPQIISDVRERERLAHYSRLGIPAPPALSIEGEVG